MRTAIGLMWTSGNHECSLCSIIGVLHIFKIFFTLVKAMKQETLQRNKAERKKNSMSTYDEYKEFEGRKYTGVKVGRTHKWYYDKGEWKEKKITPDQWDFKFSVDKKRAGQAPEGSGVPVGTEYHWYILAHQNVKKVDANKYETAMTGIKYKLVHKRADRGNWNLSEYAQKKRLVQVLEKFTAQLKGEISEN
jgi:hypothetical protein